MIWNLLSKAKEAIKTAGLTNYTVIINIISLGQRSQYLESLIREGENRSSCKGRRQRIHSLFELY